MKAYAEAYISEFNSKPKGDRERDFVDFYHLNLLKGILSPENDKNTCILRIKLTDGILFDNGKKYNVDFT